MKLTRTHLQKMIQEAITESRSTPLRRRIVKEVHEGTLSADVNELLSFRDAFFNLGGSEDLLTFAKAYAGLAEEGLTMQLHDPLDNGAEADVTQEELQAIDAAIGGMNQEIDDAISSYSSAGETQGTGTPPTY